MEPLESTNRGRVRGRRNRADRGVAGEPLELEERHMGDDRVVLRGGRDDRRAALLHFRDERGRHDGADVDQRPIVLVEDVRASSPAGRSSRPPVRACDKFRTAAGSRASAAPPCASLFQTARRELPVPGRMLRTWQSCTPTQRWRPALRGWPAERKESAAAPRGIWFEVDPHPIVNDAPAEAAQPLTKSVLRRKPSTGEVSMQGDFCHPHPSCGRSNLDHSSTCAVCRTSPPAHAEARVSRGHLHENRPAVKARAGRWFGCRRRCCRTWPG